MIWPRNGKKTNGIFSDDEPLTNGERAHSKIGNKKQTRYTYEKTRMFFFLKYTDMHQSMCNLFGCQLLSFTILMLDSV